MATDPKDPPTPTDVPKAPAAPQPEPLPPQPTEQQPEIQYPGRKSSEVDMGDAGPTGKPSRS